MRKDWELTEEAFDRFLLWLDPDREEAGKKYEDIRRHLVVIFNCRGCTEAEELTDETINRVINRSQQMADTYHGNPVPYFVTVAHHLYLEYAARRPMRSELPPQLPQPPAPDQEEEREYECFEQCIGRLPSANQELVLRYYQEDKQAKIDHRKRLAEEMGIKLNALRIRAHRIRLALQECIDECLEGGARL